MIRGSLIAVLLVAVVLLQGCGGGKSISAFKPSAQSGRQALETALKAWQSGTPYGPITSGKPAISVFDSRWRDGAKLETFEILEEAPGEHRMFKVKLKLANAPEETQTYRVVGIDPLNIYSEADYAQATGEGAAPPPSVPTVTQPQTPDE